MSSSLEIATEVLPHFKSNVLSGFKRSYGYYANAIGRNAAKESMVIGMAMHMIGAACILTRVPIAPIFYVERADREWRGVFESAYAEAENVLPEWTTLAVSARVHTYTDAEFQKLEKAISSVIPKHFPEHLQSPKELWRYLIYAKVDAENTWFRRALAAYEAIVQTERSRRANEH